MTMTHGPQQLVSSTGIPEMGRSDWHEDESSSIKIGLEEQHTWKECTGRHADESPSTQSGFE
jgi:hypothetical protein